MSAIWGLVGVVAVLGFAVYRLFPVAMEAVRQPDLSVGQWIFGIFWLIFMLYSEGWKGFHLGFSPRVVARARSLISHPDRLSAWLAPFFCFGFFRATRKRRIVAWSVTIGVVLLVLVVRWMPQPWRGLVDLGVVAGLSVGILSIFYHTFLWVFSEEPGVAHDLPPSGETSTHSFR